MSNNCKTKEVWEDEQRWGDDEEQSSSDFLSRYMGRHKAELHS